MQFIFVFTFCLLAGCISGSVDQLPPVETRLSPRDCFKKYGETCRRDATDNAGRCECIREFAACLCGKLCDPSGDTCKQMNTLAKALEMPAFKCTVPRCGLTTTTTTTSTTTTTTTTPKPPTTTEKPTTTTKKPTTTQPPKPEVQLVPFYRSYNGGIQDHFYSRTITEGAGGWNLEQLMGQVAALKQEAACSQLTPLFRMWDGGDHFYTTSWPEVESASRGSYKFEETAAYCVPAAGVCGATIPLYRLYCGSCSHGDHFYTTSESEMKRVSGWSSYTYEGIACYIWPFDKAAGKVDLVPFYRRYNGGIQDHFYSQVISEGSPSWGIEQLIGLVSAKAQAACPQLTRLYRMWNGGDHFYTTNYQEVESASRGSYKFEETAAYCVMTEGACGATVPLYRLYCGSSCHDGDHFYTTSESEMKRVSGWSSFNYEGIACYIWPEAVDE